jgi:non-heme chloroperoxidase
MPTYPSAVYGSSPRSGLARRNKKNVTEIVKIPGRGHSLTVDHGWCDVAVTTLAFVRRFVKP